MKLITALLTGALVVGGLGTNSYAMSNNQETTIKNNTSVQTDLAEQPIGSVKAIEIALNTTKGGLISNIHLDDEHGREAYKINVIHQDTEYDINVDASTGKVIQVKQADHNHNDDKSQVKSPKITLDEAKKKALTHVKGTVTEAKLDHDDNRLLYEIEINTNNHRKVEVKVDATNGDVLKVEMD